VRPVDPVGNRPLDLSRGGGAPEQTGWVGGGDVAPDTGLDFDSCFFRDDHEEVPRGREAGPQSLQPGGQIAPVLVRPTLSHAQGCFIDPPFVPVRAPPPPEGTHCHRTVLSDHRSTPFPQCCVAAEGGDIGLRRFG